MNATRGPAAIANRNWFSAALGALGIVALGALVAAVVSMSHESAHPVGQPRPAATTTASAVPARSAAPVSSPSAQPPTSWSVTAVASTMATPAPVAAPKREPSVRQRLHDMFPHLIPVP